jgi:hypothetical protein
LTHGVLISLKFLHVELGVFFNTGEPPSKGWSNPAWGEMPANHVAILRIPAIVNSQIGDRERAYRSS